MTNVETFQSSSKYAQLEPFVIRTISELDSKLEAKKYLYKGIWRDDPEPGGNVFIFEIERRKGRRKNLITLRPQHSFLRVEVYWGAKNKRLFDIHDADNLPDDLMNEIDKMYNMIAF